MRPSLALKRHIDLYEALGEGMPLQRLIEETVNQEGRYSRHSGLEIARATRTHLSRAATYLIDETMNDEIMRVAEFETPSSLRFGQHQGPSSHAGFMTFSRPIAVKEVHSQLQLIHAVTWGTVIDAGDQPGMLLTWFNDASREPDEVMLSFRGHVLDDGSVWDPLIRETDGWSIIQIHLVNDHGNIGPSRLFPDVAKIQKVKKEGVGRPLYEGHVNLLHIVLATWKLMAQELIYPDGGVMTEHPRRQDQRRAHRIGKSSSKITVVTLRRARRRQDPATRGTGEPLEYRTTVRGHYRNQAYGPRRTLRRRIWIAEHERGPEDAPLKPAKPKVIRLTR